MIDIKALAEEILETAKGILEQQESFMPVAHIFDADGGVTVIGLKFGSIAEKRAAYAYVNNYANEHGALVVILINDCKKKITTPDAEAPEGGILDDPEATDCLVLTVAEGSRTWNRIIDYSRDNDGTVVWGRDTTIGLGDGERVESLIAPVLKPTGHVQ